MATNFLGQLVKQAAYIPFKSTESTIWLRHLARRPAASARTVLKAGGRRDGSPQFGSLYLFQYDAKLKDVLPYWDMFPMCIPFKPMPATSAGSKSGFLGLNLHYLHPKLRAVLMDAIFLTVTNTKYDATTRFKLSYEILNSMAQFKYFKPCVKHYLMDHVRSSFLYIQPAEWNLALFMPLARFQKASQARVWAESEE